MRLILILVALLCTQAFARDYELVSFEASDYRDWTRQEMEGRLGDNTRHLGAYLCQNQEDLDPFWQPPQMSRDDSNLRVRAQDAKEYIYRQGVLTTLDGDPVHTSTDVFVNHALSSLDKLENLPTGAKLLRLLERAPQPVIIRLGNFSFNPTFPGGRFWSGIKNAQAIHFLRTLRMSDGGVVFN